MKTEKGYIHIYTGEGKGKTTAALGLALRAVGAGKSVYIGQFIKKGDYSELKAVKLLSETLKDKQKINIEQFGTGRFITGNPDNDEIISEHSGYENVLNAAKSEDYDLVIMDEAVTANKLGLISDREIDILLKTKKTKTELVLTGRDCSDFLKEKADLITEMKEIKHYYNDGVEAREGIEF